MSKNYEKENYEKELIKIISQQEWLMNALKVVKNLNLPDWYIAAGAIRNTVWNYFHGFPTESNQNDIDVVYYDSADLQSKNEKIIEEKLKSKLNLNWEVVNQARAHLFKQDSGKIRPAAKNSYDALTYWTETPTSIGIRLEKNGKFTICAPHGLNDLMKMKVRPPPPPYQDLILYKTRMKEKKWKKIWPKLQIFDLD